MTDEERNISHAFFAITEAMARVHGVPLPKEMLVIGDPEHGWFAELNNTDAAHGHLKRFEMGLHWNGFPAGILDPYSGVVAAGELANEQSLIEWAEQHALEN